MKWFQAKAFQGFYNNGFPICFYRKIERLRGQSVLNALALVGLYPSLKNWLSCQGFGILGNSS